MKKNQRNPIFIILVFCATLLLSTGCNSLCIDQWAECYNNCPSQEEADQEVADCLANCRNQYPNDPQAWGNCAIQCYNKSREACVDQCGDQLHRCLAEEN